MNLKNISVALRMTKYIDHEIFGMTRTHFNGFIYSVFLCTRSRRACNVSTVDRFELKRDKLRTPASSDTSSARVLALAYRLSWKVTNYSCCDSRLL